MGSSGSSKPKVDTKNLWGNYSGWLVDNKSGYDSSSSMARAKAAKSGVKGQTVDLVAGQKTSDFDTSLAGLRGGASASALRKGIEGKHPLSRPMGRSAMVGTFLYEGRDAPRPSNWVQPRKTYSVPESVGMTTTEYSKYAQVFSDRTGAKPERWEVYLTKKYGFEGDDKEAILASIAKAEKKKGTSDIGLARLFGADTEDKFSTSSPWV